MPLTGLPITDPAIAARPAVVVKVSNDPGARPQSGLEFADIVFEAWGAGPTRFATVFQSKDAPKVGPIRSARTQDVDLVGSFNGAVFVRVRAATPGVDRGHSTGTPTCWCSPRARARLAPPTKTRQRPHATCQRHRPRCAPTQTPLGQGPQCGLFRTYRDTGEAATGLSSAGFKLHIEAVHAHEWDLSDPGDQQVQAVARGKPHGLAKGDTCRIHQRRRPVDRLRAQPSRWSIARRRHDRQRRRCGVHEWKADPGALVTRSPTGWRRSPDPSKSDPSAAHPGTT